MANRIKAAVVALLLGIGLAVAVATPAQATIYWGCPHGQSCGSVDQNGGGARLTIAFSAAGLNICHNLTPGWTDKITGISSDYGYPYTLIWYEHPNCQGTISWVYQGKRNLSGGLFGNNDEASSYRVEDCPIGNGLNCSAGQGNG